MTTENQRNIDDDEIVKFSQIADKWWGKNSEFKPLHDINPLRLNYTDRLALLAGKHVLDIGCGDGILSESMAKRGAAHVTGIDMVGKSLQTAQTHAAAQKVGNIAYRCVHVEDLAAEAPHSFDVVACMEMMEYVPDPAATIKACAKLVKPDGTVLFSTVNRNPKSYLHLIVGAEYVLNFVPKGTHDWHKFITPVELTRMCRQVGLDIADTKGLKYSLLTRQFSLDSRIDVNCMIACHPAWLNLRNNKGRLKTLFSDGLDAFSAIIIRQRPISF